MFRRALAGMAAVLIAAATLSAQDSPDRVTASFTDPSRPGTVSLHLMNGSVTVKGSASAKQVVITTRTKPEDRSRRNNNNDRNRQSDRTGLTRLTPAAGFSVYEEANVMTIRPSISQEMDIEIQVPSHTNLDLNVMNGGDLIVDGVEGNIEAGNQNGDVKLTNVAGSVVAHSMNGTVLATVTRVTADKPLSFTTMNGDVDVTLPSSLKARLKLRSDMGDILSDFDVKPTTGTPPAVDSTLRSGGRLRVNVNREILGTINGGGLEVEIRTFNGDILLRKGK